MRATTLWLIGGVILSAGLLLLPIVPGYLILVSFEVHLLVFVCGLAVLGFSARCQGCGLPIWMEDRGAEAGLFRYGMTFRRPKGKCARCGAEI